MSSRSGRTARPTRQSAIVLGLVLLGAAPFAARAQTASPSGASGAPQGTAPRTAPCAAPEHRQFDFWVGEWTVTMRGRTAGTNRIERALDGCAVIEHWTGAGGGHGTSINAYDASTQHWYQTWVDDQGQVLRLEGAFRDGRMVLEGTAPTAKGTPARQRVTWTPLDSGRVRQLWEASEDNGTTWSVVFDGVYARR